MGLELWLTYITQLFQAGAGRSEAGQKPELFSPYIIFHRTSVCVCVCLRKKKYTPSSFMSILFQIKSHFVAQADSHF